MVDRQKDKIRAAQCPDCGKYMDKLIIAGLIKRAEHGGALAELKQDITMWVCWHCNKQE